MFASTYKKREKAGRRLKGTDPLLQPETINPGTEPQLQPRRPGSEEHTDYFFALSQESPELWRCTSTHAWMPKVWWSWANMHNGLIPKHSQVRGQREEEGTARHFRKPPLPGKHLPLLSIPAFKLPTPFPLHSLCPHPFPHLPPHIHTPHTPFPTKRLLSGPHAGRVFLMTLMPAAHRHDATNPGVFCASSSQSGAHTPKVERKRERGRGRTKEHIH